MTDSASRGERTPSLATPAPAPLGSAQVTPSKKNPNRRTSTPTPKPTTTTAAPAVTAANATPAVTTTPPPPVMKQTAPTRTVLPPPAAKVVKNFMNPLAEKESRTEREACIQRHERERLVRLPVAEQLEETELKEMEAMAAALRGVTWRHILPHIVHAFRHVQPAILTATSVGQRRRSVASTEPTFLTRLDALCTELLTATSSGGIIGASSSSRWAASLEVLKEVELSWVPYAALIEPLMQMLSQPLGSARTTTPATDSSSRHAHQHHNSGSRNSTMLYPVPQRLPLIVQRKIPLSNSDAKVLYQSGAARRGQVGPFTWHYQEERSDGRVPTTAATRFLPAESALDPLLDFVLLSNHAIAAQQKQWRQQHRQKKSNNSSNKMHHNNHQEHSDDDYIKEDEEGEEEDLELKNEEADAMVPLALHHLVEPEDPKTVRSSFEQNEGDAHSMYGKRNLLSFSLLRLWVCHQEELEQLNVTSSAKHPHRSPAPNHNSHYSEHNLCGPLIDSPRSVYILLKNGQKVTDLKKEPRTMSEATQNTMIQQLVAQEEEDRRLEAEPEESNATTTEMDASKRKKNTTNNNNNVTVTKEGDPTEARKLRLLADLQHQYKELCKRCSQKAAVYRFLGSSVASLLLEEPQQQGATAMNAEAGLAQQGLTPPRRLTPLGRSVGVTSPSAFASQQRPTSTASTLPTSSIGSQSVAALAAGSPLALARGEAAADASPAQLSVLSSLAKNRMIQTKQEQKKREDLAVMWGQMHAATLERAMKEDRAVALVAAALEDKRRRAQGQKRPPPLQQQPNQQLPLSNSPCSTKDSKSSSPSKQLHDSGVGLDEDSNVNGSGAASTADCGAHPSSLSPAHRPQDAVPLQEDARYVGLTPVERVRRMYAEKEAIRIHELEQGILRKEQAVRKAQQFKLSQQEDRKVECARRAADVREKCQKVKRVDDFQTYLLLCQQGESEVAMARQQLHRTELNQGIRRVLSEEHHRVTNTTGALDVARVQLMKTMHAEECQTHVAMERFYQTHPIRSGSSMLNMSSTPSLLMDRPSAAASFSGTGGLLGNVSANAEGSSVAPPSPSRLTRSVQEDLALLDHDEEEEEFNERQKELLAAQVQQAEQIRKRSLLLDCQRKKTKRVPPGVDEQLLLEETRHSLVRLLKATKYIKKGF